MKSPYMPQCCFQCFGKGRHKREVASRRPTRLAPCLRARGPMEHGCARMHAMMKRCAAQTSEGATMPVSVWTSTLKRTIQTAEHLPFPKLRWKVLLGLGCPVPTLMVFHQYAFSCWSAWWLPTPSALASCTWIRSAWPRHLKQCLAGRTSAAVSRILCSGVGQRVGCAHTRAPAPAGAGRDPRGHLRRHDL
jgi:hypothetical protein